VIGTYQGSIVQKCQNENTGLTECQDQEGQLNTEDNWFLRNYYPVSLSQDLSVLTTKDIVAIDHKEIEVILEAVEATPQPQANPSVQPNQDNANNHPSIPAQAKPSVQPNQYKEKDQTITPVALKQAQANPSAQPNIDNANSQTITGVASQHKEYKPVKTHIVKQINENTGVQGNMYTVRFDETNVNLLKNNAHVKTTLLRVNPKSTTDEKQVIVVLRSGNRTDETFMKTRAFLENLLSSAAPTKSERQGETLFPLLLVVEEVVNEPPVHSGGDALHLIPTKERVVIGKKTHIVYLKQGPKRKVKVIKKKGAIVSLQSLKLKNVLI
jgi:hypothetical protein